jgi:hypothetical protein
MPRRAPSKAKQQRDEALRSRAARRHDDIDDALRRHAKAHALAFRQRAQQDQPTQPAA